jgi:hypothetical protein
MSRPRRDGTPSTAPNKQRLSHFAIKNLKPRERPYTVWDSPSAALPSLCSRAGTRHGRRFIPNMAARAGCCCQCRVVHRAYS